MMISAGRRHPVPTIIMRGGGPLPLGPICEFLQIPRGALLCKIGPRQPVKPVGGTGIRGNLHGIKVKSRSRFSLPKSNRKESISMNSSFEEPVDHL